MAEPTRQTSTRILISPDQKDQRRSWPDPRDPTEIMWRATYAPDSITKEDLRWLVDRASTYAHIFEITQKQFLPSHAAIREHLRTYPTSSGKGSS